MKFHPLRGRHQLIFIIIFPADGTDDRACKPFQRFRHPQNVNILLFPIAAKDTGQVAIVDGIVEGNALYMVDVSDRTVNDDLHRLSQILPDQLIPLFGSQVFCFFHGSHLPFSTEYHKNLITATRKFSRIIGK